MLRFLIEHDFAENLDATTSEGVSPVVASLMVVVADTFDGGAYRSKLADSVGHMRLCGVGRDKLA